VVEHYEFVSVGVFVKLDGSRSSPEQTLQIEHHSSSPYTRQYRAMTNA
jgi:hypothetical protein